MKSIPRIVTLFPVWALLLCPVAAFAQQAITDTVIVIDDVEVVTSRLNSNYSGGKIVQIDSSVVKTYQHGSLAQLLGDATGVSIRSYGPAGLASASVRGGSSSHTAVVWNGINLQSPMNGGVNLSVIPVGLLNHIEVQYGGSGPLYGSGNMSGAIHLSNAHLDKQPNHATFGLATGSFGLWGTNASVKTGTKKQYLLVSGQYKQAMNDFLFVNTAKYGRPQQVQTNAQMEQHAASLDYGAKLSDALKMSFSALYSHNGIHIPTRMTLSSINRETQTDNNLYTSLNLKHTGQHHAIAFKMGGLYNQVRYSNPDLPTPKTDNNSQSIINELEIKETLHPNHAVTMVANYTHERARSEAFDGTPVRDRVSGVLFYKFTGPGKRLEWTTSARQESSNSRFFPVVYGTGFDFALTRLLKLKTCASTTYRIPSFNDLYWKEALAYGNPNLKPEKGWSAETTLEQHVRLPATHLIVSESVFASSFRNWIAWLPDSGGAWTPTNKDRGKSNGFEFRALAKSTIGSFKTTADLNYVLTHSEIKSDDAYNNRPMTYVPKHKAGFSGSIEKNRWMGLLQLNYHGKRYYDSSNTLDAYLVCNLHLAKDIAIWGKQIVLGGHLNNLTGSDYQVMAWYAMPKRHFSVNMNIKL